VPTTWTALRSIFTPTVEWYFSENFEWTNCWTRLVFPVQGTPTMQIFFWIIGILRLSRDGVSSP
jgi:hypothetical protein